MGPAGTAVGWEMLVPDVGKVVSSVNVVPSDLLWEVLNVNEWLGDEWFSSVGVADSAWVVDETVLSGHGGGGDEGSSEAFHGCSLNGLENY